MGFIACKRRKGEYGEFSVWDRGCGGEWLMQEGGERWV